MAIRALILDADGVVVNGERARDAFARDFGIRPETTHPFFRGEFLDCLRGEADLKERLPRHLQSWGWQGTLEEYLSFWFKAEHHVDDELLAEVDRIRALGVPAFLATNQERYRTEYLWREMGLSRHFERIFTSAEIGHLKGDIRFFEALIAGLAPIQPTDMLFWDDTAENVATARKAGLNALLYSSVADFKDAIRRFLSG